MNGGAFRAEDAHLHAQSDVQLAMHAGKDHAASRCLLCFATQTTVQCKPALTSRVPSAAPLAQTHVSSAKQGHLSTLIYNSAQGEHLCIQASYKHEPFIRQVCTVYK